uniref:heavy metal translocating P-type ATPase n=1 Tax=Turicimonas muris TaxID=1796652 RepID=UPI00402A7690
MKEHFDVTGMSCSACSARVQKAVKALNGIDDVNVNLLKNSMVVDFDPTKTGTEQIEDAVKKAGYSAIVKSEERGKGTTASSKPQEDIQAEELKNMETRLWVSIVFSVPLMYIAMAPMVGLPSPSFLSGHQNAAVNALTQFLLTIPVVFVNFKFFNIGFRSLFSRAPNMDSLVAIGSAASVFFGLFALYMMLIGLSAGNEELVAKYAHNLYFDSAAMILTLITVGKYFEARAKKRTTNAISKLLELVPDTAVVQRDGKDIEVSVDEIRPGEIVVLKTGQRIPVDGVVKEGTGSVDESSLTGESLPVEKEADSALSGGTLVTQGHFLMQVTKVGEDTALAQIIKLVDEATSSKAPVARLADKVSGIFVPTVIALAVIASVTWMLLGYSWEFALMIGVSVLVISCPCALGLATPTAIMVGSGKGAEQGILFKSAEAIESSEKVNAVVLDKTGTVTEGKPSVTDIVLFNGQTLDELLQKVYAVESKSEHPLATAISSYCAEVQISLSSSSDFKQVSGSVSGTVGNEKVEIGNLKALNIQNSQITEQALSLARQGKTPLIVKINGATKGIIAVADPIKPDSKIAIEAMKKAGQEVWMVTGDNEVTAKAVASKVGIDHIESGVLPSDKEKIVRRLQGEGKRVIMVGDGINDAPALARADVGIAIGAGTDVAIESADIVLMKNRLTDVVNAENLSHSTMNNIRQNLFWAFFYNIIGIPVAAGVFYPVLGWTLSPMIAAAAMSMSSVSVVSNALRLRGWKPKLVFNQEQRKASGANAAVISVTLKQETASVASHSASHTKAVLIEGMMCSHCSSAVEKGLSKLPGVQSVKVDLKDQLATIVFNGELSDETIKSTVEKLGYQVVKIEDLAAHERGEVLSRTQDKRKCCQTEKPVLHTKKVVIEGMMCSHCSSAVEKGLSKLPGVKNVEVDLKDKLAVLRYREVLSDETIKATVEKLGYSVKKIEE